MAQIPEHLIDRIRDSVDIVDLISRYISLKKRGKNYKALCPFHTEKTPSFTVNVQKQIFYCFGCGVGGNAFSFLMQYEKLSFIEAVKKLAGEAGIELPRFREERAAGSEFDRLYRTHQFAADFYHDLLKKHYQHIGDYLAQRGFTQESLHIFKIGFVPDAWDTLFKEITKKRMEIEPFQKSGLILQSEKESAKKYDRFRHRLMFPIHNVSGRIVAFGGRSLSDDPKAPKYLNSPESPIYKKSQILFGLNFSKEWIRQEGYAIFVEGYMDYIQLFQNGIKNVVATSGTSLTKEHARLIRRYTADTVLCYDADTAGVNAALRGGEVLFQNNLNVQILLLPEGEDPDSFVRTNEASAFYALIEKAQDYFEFKGDYLIQTVGRESISKQTTVVNDLLDTLAAHPDPLKQNFYVNNLAEKFGLQESTLISEIRKKSGILKRRERKYQERDPEKLPDDKKVLSLTGAWSAEKGVLILLLNHFNEVKNLIFEILEPEDFLNEGFRNIFTYIQQHCDPSGATELPGNNPEELVHLILSTTENQQIVGMLTADLFNEIMNPSRYLKDCILRIKETRCQTQIDFLRQKLKQLPAESQEYIAILSEIKQHMTHIQEIRKLFAQK